MGTLDKAPVFMSADEDPEMTRAYERARETFRYFWRELAWESRRIVPGCEIAAVKAAFSDGEDADPDSEDPRVEHMWISGIDFDGRVVTGELLNSPNWLKTVRAGDVVRLPLDEIEDWMYAQGGKVYGGHTVNLMRSRMSPAERRAHDTAWGFDFGDPDTIELVPSPPKRKRGGIFAGFFGGGEAPLIADPDAEHPMSVNMAPSFREQLGRDPSLLGTTDDRGWTLLHEQALAGSAPTVEVLLELGADRDRKTPDGRTPRDLAAALGWTRVIALLEA